MKGIFLATILLFGLSSTVHAYIAESVECTEAAQLDYEQRNTILRAYYYGEQYGYGYSLAAIAWKESQGGKILVNAFDPSFGVFHILLKTAASREGVTSKYHKNQVAHKLMTDERYAASHAIAELETWHKVHGENWKRIWASYNAGYNFKNGINYANDISKKVKAVKACLLRR